MRDLIFQHSQTTSENYEFADLASTAMVKVSQPPTAPMINTLITFAERVSI
jgi:hypothetical protein